MPGRASSPARVIGPRYPAQPRQTAAAPTSSAPAAAATTTKPTPTLSFEDAIKAYQAQYPGGATREAYTGLYTQLESQGYQVERPTHAGGTLPSDDKIVDKATGQVYDIIGDVNPETGAGKWTFGTSGYWVNGKPSATPPGGTAGATVLGTPGPGAAMPTRDTFGVANPYPPAYEAMRRMRARAGVGGRASTILGGFTPGRPQTRPSLLGRA